MHKTRRDSQPGFLPPSLLSEARFPLKSEYKYISGDQIKSDSFSIGGNVIGEIKIDINDLIVRYIGDVPNLTGNLLNQGNTKALFTTIEIQSNNPTGSKSEQEHRADNIYTPIPRGS